MSVDVGRYVGSLAGHTMTKVVEGTRTMPSHPRRAVRLASAPASKPLIIEALGRESSRKKAFTRLHIFIVFSSFLERHLIRLN